MFNSNRNIARVLIFGFVLFSLFLTWNLQHIRLDYNIENFFPKDDDELNYYMEFSNEFENNLNQCMLAVENQEGVFNYETSLDGFVRNSSGGFYSEVPDGRKADVCAFLGLSPDTPHSAHFGVSGLAW